MMGKLVWARRLTIASGLALACFAWPSFNDEVSMSVEPVWGQGAPAGQVIPIRVIVQNDGPDRRGTVEARGMGVSRVEIDMPRNSQKEVILYPAASMYGYESVEVTLSTQGGQIRVPVETQSMSMGDSNTCVVGLISDTLGGFSFLKNSNYQGLRFMDAYMKPGLALDRAVGYEMTDLLVLGDGAERLTDREVGAIKRYVLMGGSLVFMGGASAPVLRDARWADVLPVKNPRATSLDSVGYLNQFGTRPAGAISIMDVDAKERSISIKQGGTTILTKRASGLGTVFVLGFNLTDKPLNKWTGRLQLFAKLTQQARSSSNAFMQHSAGMAAYLGGGEEDPYGTSWGATPPGFPSPPTPVSTDDPFRAKLPPTSTIFMILAGFWVVVIPVHFFILNKLKRGELAWFTAPLIALGFAGLLFTLASGLYKAGLSTALEGVLFRADGSQEAIFAGKQQLFFPSGGRYDLGLKGVEAVLPMAANRFDMTGKSSDTSFQSNLRDIGEVIAPDATTTNLNFKEFRFAERRTEAWAIPGEINVKKVGKKIVIKGSFTNQSPYSLRTPTIYAGGQWIPIQGQVVQPGNKLPFEAEYPLTQGAPTDITVALWATFGEFEAGARIGKPADGRRQELLYSYGSFKVENP
jgi:hypothetical protein